MEFLYEEKHDIEIVRYEESNWIKFLKCLTINLTIYQLIQ